MSRWPTIRLPDVAEIIMGQSPPGDTYNEAGDGLPFFQGKTEFGEVSPTPRKWCNAPKKIAEAGDILISVRAPVGPTNLAATQCCIGRGLAAIRANPEMLEPTYLRFALRYAEPQLASMGQGSTFAAIGRAELARAGLPLPPLPEQRRIVDILSRAEGIVRLRREAEKKAAELIPAMFLDMFGDPATNPKGWPTYRIGDLFDVKGGKRLPKGEPYSDSPTAFRYIRGTNIRADKIESGNLVYLTPEIQSTIKRYVVEEGDAVITIAGKIGVAAPVEEDLIGVNLTENAAMIRPHGERKSTAIYLSSLINNEFVQKQIESLTGRVTIGKLALERIKLIEIRIPPIELQQVFVEHVLKIRSIQFQQAAATATAQATFDALLSKVFARQS